MQITFYGAVREVTGSMHLIETGDNRILLDCGMFQGRRKETNEKTEPFRLIRRPLQISCFHMPTLTTRVEFPF